MCEIIRVLIVWTALLLLSSPEHAGLRIANVLDHGRGALQVEINDKSWRLEGMQVGEVSELRRLRPGVHRLSFMREGMGKIEVRLGLDEGEVMTLIPHAYRAEHGVWEMRVLRLHHHALTQGREATVVHVGPQPHLMLEVKQARKSWTPMALKRLEPQRFPIIQHRGYLPMRLEKQALHSMPVFEKGHQVVVLYGLQNGRTASLSYRDRGWPVAPKP